MTNFSKEYWEENYQVPQEMDCYGNASLHAKHLKLIFELELVSINSIIDFGFGLGELLKEMSKVFLPYKVHGIEPSTHAYNLAVKRFSKSPYIKNKSEQLLNVDLKTWCSDYSDKVKSFDLGICTSVLQYLDDADIDYVLPIIAKKVKYLYLTVPTDFELSRQKSDLKFVDRFAQQRGKEFYYNRLEKYFTFVSCRLLESKHFFNDNNTNFTEFLYRF